MLFEYSGEILASGILNRRPHCQGSLPIVYVLVMRSQAFQRFGSSPFYRGMYHYMPESQRKSPADATGRHIASTCTLHRSARQPSTSHFIVAATQYAAAAAIVIHHHHLSPLTLADANLSISGSP